MPDPQARAERRTMLVLVPVCLAVILVVAGMTSLNLALPDIGRDLEANQTQLQWVVDAYALVLAAFVLPAGALGDRFGRKRLMIAGLVIFLVGLVWGATAGTAGHLLLARTLTGGGAALVFPATLSTLTAVFPAERRGLAIGVWAASGTVGGVLGLIGSGALIEWFWWGSVLLATAAIALVTLVLTCFLVPNTADPEHANLDPLGTLLSAAAAGGLVLAVTEGPARGWTDAMTIGALLIGVLGLGGFVSWELRSRRPLLDVRVFTHRGFATGALVVTTQFFAVFGAMFLGVQYLSYVLGYSSLGSGLALAPLGALVVPGGLVADPLARRYGRGRVEGLGLAIMAAGFLLMALMSTSSSYWQLGSGLAVVSAGFGLAAVPGTAAIVGALPLSKQGVASAINDLSRELGGALGIATLGSAFNGSYRARISASPAVPSELLDVTRDSVAAGLHAATALGQPGAPMSDAVHTAFMHGWTIAMGASTAVLAAVALLVSVRAPKTLDHDVLDDPLDLTGISSPLAPPGKRAAPPTQPPKTALT